MSTDFIINLVKKSLSDLIKKLKGEGASEKEIIEFFKILTFRSRLTKS